MPHLDSHLLRTFLAVAEAGSVTAGAERIGRSQSAVSIQLAHLEEILGAPVFDRHGRGVTLNDTGADLLSTARDVVAALDRTVKETRGKAISGKLRIGIPDEHGRDRIAAIVASFARENPNVELFVHCGLSARFGAALANGELDLAVHEVETLGPGMTRLRDEPIRWVGSRSRSVHELDPLPVALFDRACWWRDASLAALQRCGRSYRIAFASESMTGVAAAVDAGIAVGTLGESIVTGDFAARTMFVEAALGLPAMPPSRLVLERRKDAEPVLCDAMTAVILRAFGA